LETHGTRRDDAGAAGLAAIGCHRTSELKERNARHRGGCRGHAHARGVRVALLADKTRSTDRRRSKEIAATRASHAGETPARRRARQALTASARRATSAAGTQRVAPARPDAEGARRWTARQRALGTHADADVDAHPVQTGVVRAAISVVAVGIRLARLLGQRGGRTGGRYGTGDGRWVRPAAKDEGLGRVPECGREPNVFPLPHRHADEVIGARDFAAYPDGERADAITLLVGITADGPATPDHAARKWRCDALTAGDPDDPGRRYGRSEKRGDNEKRRERPGVHGRAPSRRAWDPHSTASWAPARDEERYSG